ncbi:hypothetical protein C8024_05425 [Sphingopyxis sp. BSNA05]|uniref:DUF3052 family protein n=1 Tax=Sphingopyxis sp. BSNA05 TaxID=1236614 RepID=UPI001565400F|nr:DUF3052 family protein [Sphingopyxis sp. BSNA05]NRD89012.1 hypothetical protein [Sphingopyxis sp. BSNA05]
MTAGYSTTPLAKKLSLKDGMRVWFLNMPDRVRAEIEDSGLTLSEDEVPAPGLHAAHIFVTERNAMEEHLTTLREMIDPAGQVWVSWPKKASKVETDISEDTIREVALPMGFVDIKVCAVDDIWSGLKLVIRKELR